LPVEAAGNFSPSRLLEEFPAPSVILSFLPAAPQRLAVPSRAASSAAVAIPIFQRDCAILI
jgi:hypothetical protein